MKNTPSINANGQNANNSADNTAKVVPISSLINKAKEQTAEPRQAEEIKEPTTYAQAQPETKEEAPKAEPVQAEPQPEQPNPKQAEPVPAAQTMALVPVRSRADEIAFQVEKSRQLQLINTQLTSLTAKRDELKTFSYAVDKDDDSRYGRLTIYDDNNREFVCRNHGVAALVVEFLRKVFSDKIEEKENELLTVSKS